MCANSILMVVMQPRPEPTIRLQVYDAVCVSRHHGITVKQSRM